MNSEANADADDDLGGDQMRSAVGGDCVIGGTRTSEAPETAASNENKKVRNTRELPDKADTTVANTNTVPATSATTIALYSISFPVLSVWSH